MNLAFYELEPWEQEHVRKALPGHRLSFFDGPLGAKNVDKKAEAIGIFIYSEATRKLINLMPRLKLIATLSTGFDHIDIAYAASKGIQVCNVPTYGENTVAEHTFALILSLSRKLYPSIKRTHEQHRFDTDASLRGSRWSIAGSANSAGTIRKTPPKRDLPPMFHGIYLPHAL